MTDAPLIRIEALRKSYFDGGREHCVLEDVNLDVNRGEFVVILGRSGSGKSTLLNLVGAMDTPSGGSITVDGLRVDRLDETARTLFRRRHVGFVFQSYNLIPTLTVAENLALPLALNHGGAIARDRIDDYLDRLGIGNKAMSFPDNLSGGEQQRVAIARALIHHPTLLIADEPTGNLDLETGQQVLALLDKATRAEGRTMLMATHSREVIGIADRIVTIDGGRLVEVGGAP